MLDAKLKYLYTLHSPICGAIAQLVEHLHGMQGVNGSTPFSSTRDSFTVVDVCNFRLAVPIV